jgi:hypothetical protein
MRRFEPTPDQRRTVKTMAGFGIPHTDIAPFIGIDTKTLRKHFREELDRGDDGGECQDGAVAVPHGDARQERRGGGLLDEGAWWLAGEA